MPNGGDSANGRRRSGVDVIAERRGTRLPIAATLVLAAQIASAQPSSTFAARVEHVNDGDSLIIRDARGRKITVRIHGIDAPERLQPHATQSRNSMRELTRGRTLTIIPRTTDSYGRIVGKVMIGPTDLGLTQIRRGYAWHYRFYASEQPFPDRAAYAAAERDARERRAGLWQDKSPVAPWDYRRRR